MAEKLTSCDSAEEDYIDMDISSSSNLLCYSTTSPQHPGEFEFQRSSTSLQNEEPYSISPADELFYKGKLLPLHLPPRMKMVQKLLDTSNENRTVVATSDDNYTSPFTSNKTSSIATGITSFESCNVSPSRSCRVSRDLNSSEYFLECSAELIGFIDDNTKKSWSKKLKLIKQSSLGRKLKASGAYFRSLFSKTGCSDEACATSMRRNIRVDQASARGNEYLSKYMKVGKHNPFGIIQNQRCQMTPTVKDKMNEDIGCMHRKSFSGVIKQCSPYSSPYSSLYSNTKSNKFYELQVLKRSSSDNSETESAIQGAIAHCKQHSPVSSTYGQEKEQCK